jgi:GcrA cell cycle regulator
MEWTEERIDTLRALAEQGLTAGQIAERLGGVSRNAVIGKMNRLDRPSRKAAPKPQPKPEPKPAPVVEKAAAIRAAALRPIAPPLAHRPYVEIAEPAGAVRFNGLTPKMCRWPIGDPATDAFSFCGADANAGSYCARHAVVAYPRGRAVRMLGKGRGGGATF